MYIYNTVKDEIGIGPSYPSKDKFTKIFGYAGGKFLGEFPTKDDAKAAGSKVTEENYDKEGFETAMLLFRAHENSILQEWKNRMRAKYSEVNDAQFDEIYSMAYNDGHSSGYTEVELRVDDFAEFAIKIIAAGKK